MPPTRVLAALAALLGAASLTAPPSPALAQPVAKDAAAPAPARVTRADLARLRWIAGSWRGTGDGQAPFYERYRFVDDSTLLVDSFADSTLARVTETARYELRGGRLGNTGDVRWVAVAIDGQSVSFAPVARARNGFTWRRDAADAWTAVLRWPAAGGQPERTRTYTLTRWAAPGAR